MSISRLPKIQQAAVDSAGRFTPEFYRALAAVLATVQDTTGTVSDVVDAVTDPKTGTIASVARELAQLKLAVGSLIYLANDGFVTKQGSVYSARTFQDTTTIGWTNPAGIAGDPSAAFIGNTDNVPEGVTNLYFTDARAQAASLNSVFFDDILQTSTGAALITASGDIMTV